MQVGLYASTELAQLMSHIEATMESSIIAIRKANEGLEAHQVAGEMVDRYD